MKKYNKYLYTLTGIMVSFILGFNYMMGTDWIAYQDFYENLMNVNCSYNVLTKYWFESGYIQLNRIFKIMGFSYEFFQGSIIIFFIYIIFKRFKEYKDRNLYLCIYIFVCYKMTNICYEPILRQIISATIFIYSFKYLETKKLFKYILCILIAGTFHKTAYLLICFYFIKDYKIKIWQLVLFIIVGDIAILNISSIFEVASKVIPVLIRYKIYISSGRTGIVKYIDMSHQIRVYVLAIIYLFFISRDKLDYGKRNYIKNMALILVLLFVLSLRFIILDRLNLYFVPGFILSLVAGIRTFQIKKRNKLIEKILFMFLYLLFTMYMYRVLNSSELNKFRYLNYKNYFIEYIKGNTEKDFLKKSNKYKQTINKFLDEEVKNKK